MPTESTPHAAVRRVASPTLVGRSGELATIAAAIDRARAGQGSALAVIAPAGLGKTALVHAAAAQAPADTLVLGTRGVEAELDLPFSGLQALLRPLAARVDELGADDRAVLEAVLELRDLPTASEIEVAMATLNLLSLASAEMPVLVIVDDLHWMDAATVPVLVFLARRIAHDAIAMLVAGRPVPGGGPLDAATPVPIPPLTADETGELVARHLHRPVADEVAESLATATGGNPLAVIETVRRLGPNVLVLGSELDEPLPVDQLISRAMSSRLESTRPDTLAALRVLATMLDSSAGTLHRALEELALDVAVLDPAEDDGIVVRGPGTIAFAHPLLRSLVFHGTSPAERRRAHAALAPATQDAGARAWHAASATPTEDERLAAALADQAGHFAARGGHLAAAKALVLAAQVSPEPDPRGLRLLHAAEEARLAGRSDWTVELLDQAAAASRDPALQLRVRRGHAILTAYATEQQTSTSAMHELATEAVAVDPDLAREIFADLANYALVEGEMDAARQANDAAVALGPSERDDLRTSVEFSVAYAELLTGDAPRQAADAIQALDFGKLTLVSKTVAAEALSWIEDHDGALRLLNQCDAAARADGNARARVTSKTLIGYVHYRRGEWREAAVALDEGGRLAEATGQHWDAAIIAAIAGIIDCSRGRPGALAAMAALQDEAVADHYESIAFHAANALGVGELAAGRAAEAVPHLERAREFALQAEWVEPGVLPWPADLAEAYATAGRIDEARAAVAWLRDRAEQTGRPWAHAAVARLEAVLAGDDFEARFARALELHEHTLAPFDLARTQLAYGRRLRRAKRRADARVQLQAALTGFDALGAVAWADQARAELRAAGVAVAGDDAVGVEVELTSQESVVAELVAQGLSNKQIAAQLFLTPKTVEWHLGQMFRKLGIRSRVQLASHVRRSAPLQAQA